MICDRIDMTFNHIGNEVQTMKSGLMEWMNLYSIRHMKSQLAIKLPSIHNHLIECELSNEKKELYNITMKEVKKVLERHPTKNEIYRLLQKMRTLLTWCTVEQLSIIKNFGTLNFTKHEFNETNEKPYNNDDCPICFELFDMRVPHIVHPCKHAFCKECLAMLIQRNMNCGLCRGPINRNTIKIYKREQVNVKIDVDVKEDTEYPKIKILEDLLKNKIPLDERVVVFSSNVETLRKIEGVLKKKTVVRITSDVPMKKRYKFLSNFYYGVSNEENKKLPRVLLVTYSAAGIGLNLVGKGFLVKWRRRGEGYVFSLINTNIIFSCVFFFFNQYYHMFFL